MSNHLERARAIVRGTVQGVGFRQFVQQLARQLHLVGWVANSPQGVSIELEGTGTALRQFLVRVEREKPAQAIIQSLEFSFLDAIGYSEFTVLDRETSGADSPLILPDIATCPHCVMEVFQPGNRRYRYPFANCTHCGPRFTIIESMPYDRTNTSMKKFPMCMLCEREYHHVGDRRFHAHPNSCPACGPQLQLWDSGGNVVAEHDDALHLAAEDIRAGKIVAIKGRGGFHLFADARDETVVRLLRKRKRRSEKPFALMYPSLTMVREHCRVSELEERLLLSPEAPIVLLQAWSPPLAPSVAPGNPTLGVMLPSTAMHHLLMRDLGYPVVVASGNITDEPICIDEHEALTRLHDIADFYLVHNRPIVRAMDDSVTRVRFTSRPSCPARWPSVRTRKIRWRSAWGATSLSATRLATWKRVKRRQPSAMPRPTCPDFTTRSRRSSRATFTPITSRAAMRRTWRRSSTPGFTPSNITGRMSFPA
jgi:hydrogenase maturation protein HypF